MPEILNSNAFPSSSMLKKETVERKAEMARRSRNFKDFGLGGKGRALATLWKKHRCITHLYGGLPILKAHQAGPGI